MKRDLATVRYEFQMLAGTVIRLANNVAATDNIINNALIESFALHCRALIHFFHSDAKKKDGTCLFGVVYPTDVIAEDFFLQTGTAWRKKPPITATLIRAKDMADKQVAHITEQRRSLNTNRARGKRWPFSRIYNHLSATMDSFLHDVPNLIKLNRQEIEKIRAALYVDSQ